MTIKGIQARAGSITGYIFYIFLMFGWYFLDNFYTSIRPISAGSWIEPLLVLAVRILIYPLLLAGIFGGIHEHQQALENWDLSGFFTGITKNYLRMLGANLLYVIVFAFIAIVAFGTGLIKQIDFSDNQSLYAIIVIPYSAVMLFWFILIVTERKFIPLTVESLKAVGLNPYALLLGLSWGAASFANTFFFDYQTAPISLPVNGLRAAALAVIRILTIVYVFAAYKHFRGYASNTLAEDDSPVTQSLPSSDDKLTKVAFGFAFASFVPILHLVALTLGILAFIRKKSFGIRTVIACCFGGFFTAFYALMLLGWLASGTPASKTPGYAFLADVEPNLRPQVQLLEKGLYQEALPQLEKAAGNTNTSWALDCALAIVKTHSFNSKGALEDFYRAAGKNPERGEFYYYYGVALLQDNQLERAGEQFRLALQHQPQLEEAERYSTLLSTAYTPSKIVSSLLFIVILLVMFSFHEYGHAFTAWKLGDDTAERQGRLTLNPIRHLDLFGSIILPAILIFQQSGMVFGWAKPVPVDPRNFKDPQRDHMRVAFAGPAVNLFFSMACFIILGLMMLVIRIIWPNTLALNIASAYAPVSLVGPSIARWLVVIIAFIKQLFYTSLMLGFLNLIPIPPLDGSWILSGLLPRKLSEFLENTRGFGNIFFLLLVVTPALDYFLAIPIGVAMGCLELLVAAMRFG